MANLDVWCSCEMPSSLTASNLHTIWGVGSDLSLERETLMAMVLSELQISEM